MRRTHGLWAIAGAAALGACGLFVGVPDGDTLGNPFGGDAAPEDGAARDANAPADANRPTDGPATDVVVAFDAPAEGGSSPPPPVLGLQIDRIGRAGTNPLLDHTFDPSVAMTGAAKDAWNADSNVAGWQGYASQIEVNLAIFDGLDSTCGNQILADMTKTDATRYATLAGVLADDRLWVDTSKQSCTSYLAVESAAAGLPGSGDCGGRMPQYDVMKISYSLMAVGAPSGITDGTTVPARAQVMAFPFLTSPQ